MSSTTHTHSLPASEEKQNAPLLPDPRGATLDVMGDLRENFGTVFGQALQNIVEFQEGQEITREEFMTKLDEAIKGLEKGLDKGFTDLPEATVGYTSPGTKAIRERRERTETIVKSMKALLGDCFPEDDDTRITAQVLEQRLSEKLDLLLDDSEGWNKLGLNEANMSYIRDAVERAAGQVRNDIGGNVKEHNASLPKPEKYTTFDKGLLTAIVGILGAEMFFSVKGITPYVKQTAEQWARLPEQANSAIGQFIQENPSLTTAGSGAGVVVASILLTGLAFSGTRRFLQGTKEFMLRRKHNPENAGSLSKTFGAKNMLLGAAMAGVAFTGAIKGLVPIHVLGIESEAVTGKVESKETADVTKAVRLAVQNIESFDRQLADALVKTIKEGDLYVAQEEKRGGAGPASMSKKILFEGTADPSFTSLSGKTDTFSQSMKAVVVNIPGTDNDSATGYNDEVKKVYKKLHGEEKNIVDNLNACISEMEQLIQNPDKYAMETLGKRVASLLESFGKQTESTQKELGNIVATFTTEITKLINMANQRYSGTAPVNFVPKIDSVQLNNNSVIDDILEATKNTPTVKFYTSEEIVGFMDTDRGLFTPEEKASIEAEAKLWGWSVEVLSRIVDIGLLAYLGYKRNRKYSYEQIHAAAQRAKEFQEELITKLHETVQSLDGIIDTKTYFTPERVEKAFQAALKIQGDKAEGNIVVRNLKRLGRGILKAKDIVTSTDTTEHRKLAKHAKDIAAMNVSHARTSGVDMDFARVFLEELFGVKVLDKKGVKIEDFLTSIKKTLEKNEKKAKGREEKGEKLRQNQLSDLTNELYDKAELELGIYELKLLTIVSQQKRQVASNLYRQFGEDLAAIDDEEMPLDITKSPDEIFASLGWAKRWKEAVDSIPDSTATSTVEPPHVPAPSAAPKRPTIKLTVRGKDSEY